MVSIQSRGHKGNGGTTKAAIWLATKATPEELRAMAYCLIRERLEAMDDGHLADVVWGMLDNRSPERVFREPFPDGYMCMDSDFPERMEDADPASRRQAMAATVTILRRSAAEFPKILNRFDVALREATKEQRTRIGFVLPVILSGLI